MLNKKRVDKKLKKYIKEHLSIGYSKHAVRKVLAEHGYNEHYIDGMLKKHSEIQFVKKYALSVLLLFAVSIFLFDMALTKDQQQKIIGYVIAGSEEGCCTAACIEAPKNECSGSFEAKKCNETESCRLSYFKKEA